MSAIKTNPTKPKILILCSYYLPGYKSGGSLRTIVNTVERLNKSFDFKIITFDHDIDKIPYETVKTNRWNKTQNAEVYYYSKDALKISKLRELIKQVAPDAIYMNSVFSILTVYALLLRKFRLVPAVSYILAPEGELAKGALELKSNKKKAFLKFAKTIGLHDKLIWKTTSEYEKTEVEAIKGRDGKIFIAPNLPSKNFLDDYDQLLKPEKKAGSAKMVFLSRFMKTKNFNWLLNLISEVRGELQIDIYGNIEDEEYWAESRRLIENLPDYLNIEYKGSITHEKVVETLFRYHFFILPTLGENFGHVFIEALSAGCPLIISDRTPWRNLENKNIGWDLSLDDPKEWIETINECLHLDNENYSTLSRATRDYAVRWLADPILEEDTLRVLNHSVTNTLTNAS